MCLTVVYGCSSSRLPASVSEGVDAVNVDVIPSIDSYFDNFVQPVPDSVIRAVDFVLSRVEGDTAEMNRLARYLLDRYLGRVYAGESKMIGIENVIVHIIDNYYLTGKATSNDEWFVNEITEYASKSRASLVGMQSRNLKMETINGVAESLYDIDSPYILLCFYDADCEHCQHEIPKIYRIFQRYKKRGLAGFCVYTRDDRKEWLSFVSKYKLTDWINAWDPTNESDFRMAYGLYYVPQVYVLDRDRKIAGRGLDSVSLSQLLSCLIKK
jgi:peroxiredoxin